MRVPAKNGCGKASIQWFLDDRPYGKPHLLQRQTSHFYQGPLPYVPSSCLPAKWVSVILSCTESKL